jgi:hypothetical protein
MAEDDFKGQDLISIGIRVENFGGRMIEILPKNAYLEQNGTRIYALDIIPVSAVDPNPLELPASILPGGTAVGELYFTSRNELAVSMEWLLVIDFTDQGLGAAQFEVSGE